jgi:hypothetical protein
VSLKEIEGAPGAVKAETCDECGSYAKMLYQAQDADVHPFADDLAKLGPDLLVAEAGWARHAPNPLLLLEHDPEKPVLGKAGVDTDFRERACQWKNLDPDPIKSSAVGR